MRKIDETVDQRVQTSSYKIISGALVDSTVTIVDNTVLYT